MLDVGFADRSFDALAATAPERATLVAEAAGLVLSLPVARRIAAVRLVAAVAGDAVAAFRFDGEAVSDDPVAVGGHGPQGGAIDVTAGQLLLRRRRGGSDAALAPADIAAVTLAVSPQGAGVGVEVVGGPDGVVFLAPETGAGGVPVFPATISRGPAFAALLSTAIGRFSDERRGVLPDPIEVDLVLEADTPCLVTVTGFDLGYLLERRHLEEGGQAVDKRVLRFAGGRVETREVALTGLAGVVVQAATVRLSPAARAAPGRAARAAAALPGPDLAAAGATGIALAAGTLVAARRELVAPDAVTAADIVAAAADAGRRRRPSCSLPMPAGRRGSVSASWRRSCCAPAGPALSPPASSRRWSCRRVRSGSP